MIIWDHKSIIKMYLQYKYNGNKDYHLRYNY